MGEVDSAVGLFYPWMSLKDRRWLNTTLLYWDGLQRIVPAGYRPSNDLRVVQKLRDDGGLIVDLEPLPSAVVRATATFVAVVDDLADELRSRHGVSGVELWPHHDPDGRRATRHVDERFAWIHIEKMSWSATEHLVDLGLAVRQRGDDPAWLGMHPDLVNAYMALLAGFVGDETSARPLTNDPYAHTVATGDRTASTRTQLLHPDVSHSDDLVDDLARATLELAIPAGIERLRLSDLISFRDRHEGERRDFHRGLTSLAAELRTKGQGLGPDRQAFIEQFIRDEILPAVDGMRRGWIDRGMDLVDLVLVASVPIAVDRAVENPFGVLAAALAAVALQTDGYRDSRVADPVAGYLDLAQRKLAPAAAAALMPFQS